MRSLVLKSVLLYEELWSRADGVRDIVQANSRASGRVQRRVGRLREPHYLTTVGLGEGNESGPSRSENQSKGAFANSVAVFVTCAEAK
jgi:hypothetical protein